MAREGHLIIKDSSIAAYMRRLRGEQAEGSKKIKLRQAYQYPFCAKCGDYVQSFRMEKFQQDEMNMIALIATCHGETHDKVIPENGGTLQNLKVFFDDKQMFTNNPQGRSHIIKIR